MPENKMQPVRKGILLAVAVAAAAPLAFGQFGGKEGDVVIFMLTSKGKGGLTLTSPTTPNSAANVNNLQILDPRAMPLDPAAQPGIFFPNYQLKVLHDEPNDKMQLLTNLEGLPTLHHMYLVTFKLFTLVTALEQGVPPGRVYDEKSPQFLPQCNNWKVSNAEGAGPSKYIDLWTATQDSINVVFAQLARDVGPPNIAKTRRMPLELGTFSALMQNVSLLLR